MNKWNKHTRYGNANNGTILILEIAALTFLIWYILWLFEQIFA